jgi:hypothetical protein
VSDSRFPFADGLRFGIHAGQQYTDFPSYLELWRTAEGLGLELSALELAPTLRRELS